MLPDFPKIKNKIARNLTMYGREKIKSGFLGGKIRHRLQHEGDRFVMKTFDGYTDREKYKDFESKFTITADEVIKSGPKAFNKYIDKVVEDSIKFQYGMLIQKMNKITEQTGNVVDAKGKPLSPEMLLSMLDKVEIDFDDNDKPILPILHVSSNLWKKLKEKIPKWEVDQKYRKKHDKIIEKKRREWLDRESRRKLVD